jgi:hypothetical protein
VSQHASLYNRGKSFQKWACKISPDMTCILLLAQPCENEKIKEWRGVASLRRETEMKGFYLFSFNRLMCIGAISLPALLMIGFSALFLCPQR